MKKLRNENKSKYLISQLESFIWLYLTTLFIKITCWFNQITLKIDTCIKLIKWNQMKKIYRRVVFIRNIIKK